MTTLLPKDIPGAVLQDGVSLEDHSVFQLKRWLECRGLKRTGTKCELIIRIKNCIATGNGDKIFVGVDGGKWYDMKRNFVQSAGQSHQLSQFSWDDISWGKFPSVNVPTYFTKGNIYTYVIGDNVENVDPESVEVGEDQTFSTVKPFRKGYQFVNSEHLSDIHDGQHKNIYACRCSCLSSFQKTVKYGVSIAINKITGAIIKGLCECKQSSLGKCTHVTALLLFIWEYVKKNGNIIVAGTSKPREWGKGSLKRNPGGIKEAKYHIKRYNPSQRAVFDPRPSDYVRNPDINQFVVDLQKVGVNSAFQSICHIKYENFNYTVDEINLIKFQTAIFLTNMRRFVNSHPKTVFEIPNTCPQGSEEWLRWRSFFITSSNTKIATTQLKSDSARKNFLLKNLWRMSPPVLTLAMRYGKDNENIARTEYCRMFLEETQRMVECGLVVNKRYPFFATSVDGCVWKDNEIQYLIEIKCPKILEKCTMLSEFDAFISKSQCNDFFLKKQDGRIKIRHNHPYLYQILMSLIIFDLDMCHLIVWCPKSLLVVPVYKAEHLNIVDEITKKAKHFYCNVYAPETITMRTVRDLFPIDVKIYD